jgi:hypothetical protein
LNQLFKNVFSGIIGPRNTQNYDFIITSFDEQKWIFQIKISYGIHFNLIDLIFQDHNLVNFEFYFFLTLDIDDNFNSTKLKI